MSQLAGSISTRNIWIAVFLAVLVYTGISFYADFDDLSSALGKFDLILIPALLALTTMGIVFRAIILHVLIRKSGVDMIFKESASTVISSAPMALTPGKIGEVIWVGWLISRMHNEPMSKTVPAPFMQRALDVFVLAMFSFLGLLHYQKGIYLIVILLTGVAGLYMAVRFQSISRLVIQMVDRVIRRHVVNLEAMYRVFYRLIRIKNLSIVVFLNIILWCFIYAELYLIVSAYDQPISLAETVFIFSFSALLGGLSMLPGGIGVVEVGMIGLLEVFGCTSASAVAISIIFRLFFLWYPLLLGFTFNYFIYRGRSVNIDQKTKGF